jgi:hypothetical protein
VGAEVEDYGGGALLMITLSYWGLLVIVLYSLALGFLGCCLSLIDWEKG